MNSFILQDSSLQLWSVTIDDSGLLHSTAVGSGAVTPVTLNDSSEATTWRVGVTTGGLLTTTSLAEAPNPNSFVLTSSTGETVWSIGVTLAGNLIVNQTPFTIAPIMPMIAAGLFDAATVTVNTIYWNIGEQPSQGVARGSIISFLGQVTKVSDLGRDKADLEVADMLYQLNLLTPPNLIQSPCRHQFGDSGCTGSGTVTRAKFSLSNSAAAGSTTLQINLSVGANTAPWWNGIITFTQGDILFTSGKNAGLRGYIKKLNSNTQILLANPMPFPVATGDTFTMVAGCDKTIPTCSNGFNNLINIGNTPFVPNPELGL